MSECLSEQQLETLAAGRLPDSEAAPLRAHLQACPSCREAFDEWRANVAFEARFAGVLPGSGSSGRKTNGRPASPSTDTVLLNEALGNPRVDTIPGYTVIREIHRGGQGVVYEAVQRSTRRTVALKVMIDGPFASERARWRFEREVRFIALLKHPNIVVVHDSGVSEDRHYFAMDYISGEPLDEYVRGRRLEPPDTVGLFHRICDAVSYAHRRGIIHRDLKPSNILVNEEGTPFVLDFGLAKATGDELLESIDDRVSLPGHLMGTLRYMSPEQTSGKPEEIDIRTDVYSLGVILFELLTGEVPYETTRADITTAIRNIRETDPPRLSKQHRHIGSELEAIVLKALEKDPRRRYQSADDLGQDLLAWQQGRPVGAKSASSLYVIRKLAAKHWYNTTMVGALVVVVVALGTLGIEAVLGKAQAQQDRDTARTQQAALQVSGAADARQAVTRNLLGWFLTEWHAGRLEQARRFVSEFRPATPEKMAAEFLLDEDYPADRLIEEMPPLSSQLAYFAIGERAAKAGHRDAAIRAFQEDARRSIEAHTDDLILSLANARLVQLGALPVHGPDHPQAHTRKEVVRSEG